MSSQQRLWAALEAIPGLCGVTAEWRSLLGDEYEVASRFLRPDGRSASVYPCPSPRPCWCAHDVVRHGPGDIVAVCTCEPRECDTLPLTEADIVLYEVDRQALGGAVARALGVVPEHATVPHVPTTWSIGTYSPSSERRFPVYLTVQVESDDLRQVVDSLIARAERPFLLVSPTRRMFRTSFEEPLRRIGAHFLTLAGDFALDATGEIVPCRPVAEILAPFLDVVLPDRASQRSASESGQRCLGLAASEVRVVRAYQEWEARRAKRRGLPVSPTLDDLVAEADLSRPTVIRARKLLLQESILEQIPGARRGTLRLTTRGLDLQLPSDTPTVKSSVK